MKRAWPDLCVFMPTCQIKLHSCNPQNTAKPNKRHVDVDLNSQRFYQPMVLFTATVSAGCCGCNLVTRFAAATCGSSLHTSVLLSRNLTFSPHHMSREPRPNVLHNSGELLRAAQSSAEDAGTESRAVPSEVGQLLSEESRRGRVHSERTSKECCSLVFWVPIRLRSGSAVSDDRHG